MKVNDLEIYWLGHSGFQIKRTKTIYIDPYNIQGEKEKADIILLTHSHQDHCNYQDLKKIIKEGTTIVMTADCQSKVTRFNVPIKMKIIEPNQEMTLGDLKISTIPAYNINKHFHPKEEQWLGYILKIGDTIIYHAGDTDFISEMQKLTGYNQPNKKFLALLPIGGRFTMGAEEASEAANLIKPHIAIPMHWGSIIGSMEDAKEFKELCEEKGITVEILEKS